MQTLFNTLFPTINPTAATGRLRTQPEDFNVEEIIDVDFSGTGEHLWVWVEKAGCNTDWVARQLAKVCGVPFRAVGYAGLKDRQAVTRQWFSVQLPRTDEQGAIQSALPEGIQVHSVHRHSRKLKTGGLKGNRFCLVIRDYQGERSVTEQALENIRQNGVPNYFGEQRFGHGLSNIDKAKAWFGGELTPRDRKLQGILLSAARSWIFNHIVAERIRSDCWSKPIDGDIFQLAGSRSWFQEAVSSEISRRLEEHDIHITAALWGDGDVQSSGAAAHLESSIADQFPLLQTGLTNTRVAPDRRAIRMQVSELTYAWNDDQLIVEFVLAAGSYATAVIRELINSHPGN